MYLLLVTLLMFIPSMGQAANIVDVGQLQLVAEPFTAPTTIRELGYDVSRGVKARVQLESQPHLDASEPLDGDRYHYLISVIFIEEATGKELLAGQVAARTITEDKRSAKTVRLEPQELKWTGLLVLPTRGETMIKIGSKLSDGKKRIYRFFYVQDPIRSRLENISPAE